MAVPEMVETLKELGYQVENVYAEFYAATNTFDEIETAALINELEGIDSGIAEVRSILRKHQEAR